MTPVMRLHPLCATSVLAFVVFLSSSSVAFEGQLPVPAQDAILDEFDRHPIVAIGEMHRNIEEHEFLRKLITNPRFPEKATNIVVEFGNARYQPMMDRYLAGEEVSAADLSQAWRYTTQFMVWDAPVYAKFFSTVRDLNLRLPKARRLRVLLADPPIDWAKVKTKADYEPYAARDPDSVDVIVPEVLAKGQRALLIFGGAHLEHTDPLKPACDKQGLPSITQILDERFPGQTFVVWPIAGTGPAAKVAETWRPETVLSVHDTAVGRASFAQLTPGSVTILKVVDGKRVPYPVKVGDYAKVEDVVDALLYLGPVSTESVPPLSTYRDVKYVEDLRFWAQIMKEVYGVDFSSDLDEVLDKLKADKP